jgi:glucans biosynthesis protein
MRLGWLLLWCACLGVSTADATTFDDVVKQARALAAKPFEPNRGIPDALRSSLTPTREQSSFDQYGIRFKPEATLWAGKPSSFRLQLFHPGLYYDRVVRMIEINENGAQPIPFHKDWFEYGSPTLADQVPADLGYAGFKLFYGLYQREPLNEVASFVGASYFRAIGQEQWWGSSARGVAINTALPSGEEYPYFIAHYLVQPGSTDKDAVVYSLLNGPSITGAYQFVIAPGKNTVMDVEARLFLRKGVTKLGLAPLTSMFLYGENTTERRPLGILPEIHDADGLLIAYRQGEWLWRPLSNPQRLSIDAFTADNPVGFGLLQRDRSYDHYLDPAFQYQKRPSVWVTPHGYWGKGHVELVQIPSDADVNDNVVAYFVPDQQPKPEEALALSYRLDWTKEEVTPPELAHTFNTFVRQDGERKHFLVMFQGGEMQKLAADAALDIVVRAMPSGEPIPGATVAHDANANAWRLEFSVPQKNDIKEVRAFLARGSQVLTETWSYVP